MFLELNGADPRGGARHAPVPRAARSPRTPRSCAAAQEAAALAGNGGLSYEHESVAGADVIAGAPRRARRRGGADTLPGRSSGRSPRTRSSAATTRAGAARARSSRSATAPERRRLAPLADDVDPARAARRAASSPTSSRRARDPDVVRFTRVPVEPGDGLRRRAGSAATSRAGTTGRGRGSRSSAPTTASSSASAAIVDLDLDAAPGRDRLRRRAGGPRPRRRRARDRASSRAGRSTSSASSASSCDSTSTTPRRCASPSARLQPRGRPPLAPLQGRPPRRHRDLLAAPHRSAVAAIRGGGGRVSSSRRPQARTPHPHPRVGACPFPLPARLPGRGARVRAGVVPISTFTEDDGPLG